MAGLVDPFKEALIAAVVALLLAIPLLGIETVQQPHGLILQTRWSWVAIGRSWRKTAGVKNACSR